MNRFFSKLASAWRQGPGGPTAAETDAEAWWLPLCPETPPDHAALSERGADMIRLMRSGLKVPAGALLTPRLFHDFYFLEEAAVRRFIDQAVSPHARPDTLWAVRSSVWGENDPAAAAQDQVFFNVSLAGLFDRVKQCWQSAYPDPAGVYRPRQGPGQEWSLAVILQRMVPALCAGVLSTPRPENPGQQDIIIEGLAASLEAPAPGRRQADRIILSSKGRRLSEQTAGRVNCLDQVGDHVFADLARELERTCGGPQEAEWAYDGQTLWVLQTRPRP